MINKYDFIIIGGGPGGYVTAIRAAQLGFKTALVEKEHLGGVCLNWGCIPTKALLRSSEVYELINNASDFGLVVGDVKFDINKVVERSRKISKRLTSGVSMLLKKNKVSLFEGQGELIDKNRINIRDNKDNKLELTAKNIIIATGARAKTFPNLHALNLPNRI